jgi:hypothetical protein
LDIGIVPTSDGSEYVNNNLDIQTD